MENTILVDLDGVLTDMDKGFLNIWTRQYPQNPVVPLEQRRNFFIEDDYPIEFREIIDRIRMSPGFYRNLPTISGGKEALEEMLCMGLKVFICTTPKIPHENCVLEKYDWVNEHLGREWTRKIVMTKDKTLVRGKYLIDDKPKITGSQTPVWEQIFYDQPYNRHINKKRMTWQNWKEVLLNESF